MGNFGVDWHLKLTKVLSYGGFFKRLIGLVKSQLKIQFGNARLNIDELSTILLEIGRILNTRSITHDYPTNLDKCLTPDNLLLGRRLEAHCIETIHKQKLLARLLIQNILLLYLTTSRIDGEPNI